MKEWIATIPVTESFMVLANIPKSKFPDTGTYTRIVAAQV